MIKKIMMLCGVAVTLVISGCSSSLFSNPRLEHKDEKKSLWSKQIGGKSEKNATDGINYAKLSKYQFVYKNAINELPQDMDSKQKDYFMQAVYFYNKNENGKNAKAFLEHDLSGCNLGGEAIFQSPYDTCFFHLVEKTSEHNDKDFYKWVNNNKIADFLASLPLSDNAKQTHTEHINSVIKKLRQD